LKGRGDLDLNAINTCEKIKQDLDAVVGKQIMLRANRGRKRIIEEVGILEKTYPNIFIVRINEDTGKTRRVSYTYADILTKTVELRVCDSNKQKVKKASN
jgi:uncharacterized protein Veg